MNLEELIPIYGDHNSEFNSLKKICASENEEIKKLMSKENLTEKSYGGYKVTYSVSERESLNEDAMLEILKEDWEKNHKNEDCPYIKTKEYIDMDELEKALYSNSIDNDVLVALDGCRTVSEVVTLRCHKQKKGDD